MELSEDDIVTGLKAGLKDCSVVPVFCGSALSCVGTEVLLRAITDYVPDPSGVEGIKVGGPTVGFVFKTISDQFGKYSFVKIVSGRLHLICLCAICVPEVLISSVGFTSCQEKEHRGQGGRLW